MTTNVAEPNREERYGLFRKQAVEKQQDRLLGDVLVVPPVSYSLITTVLVLFTIAGITLLINGTYTRKETVHGFLGPNTGVIKVYASSPGVTQSILVREGDSVAVDQPLMIINDGHILENGEHLEKLMLLEYQAQQDLLTNQLERLPNYFASKELALAHNIEAIKTDIDHIEVQLENIKQQADLANKQYNNIKTLNSSNLASNVDLDIANEKNLSLRNQYQELRRTLSSRRNTLESLELERSQLAFDQLNQQDQLSQSLSVNAQSIAQLQSQIGYIIKANKEGVVSNIQINEGQETQTNKPLMIITPTGSELEAELLVPARAIGFIEKGQEIKIRYSAFSFQKFGLYDATITNVSQTVLLPDELIGLAINAQEPMYRVTAKLAKQHIDAYGKTLNLKEGISLEADIQLEDRSLLEWLFEPLFSLKGRL